MSDKLRVLLVEDDPDYAMIVKLCLEEREAMGLDFELDIATRLAEGLVKLSVSRYDAILVDLTLPDASGLEAARRMLAAAPDTALIIATGMGDERTALEAMRLGAQDFMIKSSSDSRLLKRSIRYAVERKSAQLQREAAFKRVEQLKAEVSESRRLDELKDRWIETLSHELRAPLALVVNAIGELQEGLAGPLTAGQATLSAIAGRQAGRVYKLVTALLDLSRLESGALEARLGPVDPREIALRVARDFSRAAADRAVELKLDLPAEPARMTADPDLLEQLLVNLVDNALRFARSRVTVSLRGGERVELEVGDDGVGIPPEKLELLFTRFSQLERREHEDYKGTGLGLAICRQIVQLHGGRISATSEPDKGTRFRVLLPADGAAVRS